MTDSPASSLLSRTAVRLAAVALLCALPVGCRWFSRQQAAAPPSPGATPSIDVAPNVLPYGYETWTVKRPIQLSLGPLSSINLVSGQLLINVEFAPDPAIAHREKEFDKLSRAVAEKRARQELRNALLNIAVSDRFNPVQPMPLSQAMEREPELRRGVEGVLRSGVKTQSRKEEWAWRVTSSVDLRRYPWLANRVLFLNDRAYSEPFWRAIPPRKLVDGSPFPAFSLRDTLTGKPYSLAAPVTNRTVLFVFWLPDDYGSIWELRQVDEFYRKHKGKGLEVWGVVASGSKRLAQEVLRVSKVSFPNLYDEKSVLSKKVGAGVHPYYVLVDRTRDDRIDFQAYGTWHGQRQTAGGLQTMASRVLRLLK